MKKYLFILTTLFAYTQINAQDPTDALRYSWITSGGSARQQAIGSAMTSLGGDISATFVNPAGLGFYKTGDLVFSPGFNFLNNKATYISRTEADKKSNLSYGTSGFVIGTGTDYKKRKNSGAAFSIAINRTASFGNNLLYRGLNNKSSYSQKFLEEIQNNNDKDANNVASNYPFGTSLAFNTYWIDTIAGGSSGNYQFKTRAPIASGLLQENAVTETGGITELGFAAAINTNDKLFYGATLGLPIVNYTRNATFTEADATNNTANNFDFAAITDNLNTTGLGVNAKLGIIYKPQEFLRLGLAIHTPTFYSLTDKYSTNVTTNTETYKGQLTQSSSTLTGGVDGKSAYYLISPFRVMASASYVFREIQDVRKQKGFLTADIEYVNYKSSSFKTDAQSDNTTSTKNYYTQLNSTIKNIYKPAFNFKIGGELKFTTIMARLGAAYYGNPYKDLGHGEKGSRFQLSGGLGYRNKGMFVDLTYVHTMGKDVQFAYRLQNNPFYGANIKSTNGNVLLTVGFKI